MDRGIIISPRYTYQNGVTTTDMSIGKADLWFYLTYWDQVLVPQLMHPTTISFPKDIEDIKGQFIVVNQEIIFPFPKGSSLQGLPGYIPKNPMQQLALACYQAHEAEEPGKWSLGRPIGASDRTAEPAEPKTKHFEFELYNLLPIPGPDVPLVEIIDFRNRRQAELWELRDAMDSLSRELSNSSDLPRHKTQVMRRLETAIQDISKASKSSWRTSQILSSWGAVDLGAAVVVAQGLLTDNIELSASVSLAQGILKVVQSPRIKKDSPFQYIHGLPIGREQYAPDEHGLIFTFTDQVEEKDGSMSNYSRITLPIPK